MAEVVGSSISWGGPTPTPLGSRVQSDQVECACIREQRWVSASTHARHRRKDLMKKRDVENAQIAQIATHKLRPGRF